MRNVLAIHEGRVRRRVAAMLRYEPSILRGLTWSHFEYVALLAMTFGVGRVLQQELDPPVAIAWSWIPLYSISGVLVLLFAVVLTNITVRIPRLVVLGIAVVAGGAVAMLLHNWLSLSSDISFGNSINKVRVIVLQWGMAALTYYFVERSAQRAAKLREAELQKREMEARMVEARLQVMQAQVEPHFLFNTLAHVQRLYHIDPRRGRSMLDSFCDYVRAALPHMRGNHSTLEREVTLARAYLDMQRIRMGQRLHFAIAIPGPLFAAGFPPMMLLSLVENAIKHGIAPLRRGGSIRIAAVSEDNALRVTVADTGAGFSATEVSTGDGVGLSNIRSRLLALYRGRARLTLARNDPHGVVATIEVPLHVDLGGAKDSDAERVSRAAEDDHPSSRLRDRYVRVDSTSRIG